MRHYIELASWVFVMVVIVLYMRRISVLKGEAALHKEKFEGREREIRVNRRYLCLFCNSLITDPRVTITQGESHFYVFESGTRVSAHHGIDQLLEDVLERTKK